MSLVFAMVLVNMFSGSAAHHYIESRIGLKLYFAARNAVHPDRTLDPRLKIFSFDDSSFATLKAPALNLRTWVELLEALDRKQPAAIYVDQIFSITPEASADKDELLQRLGKIETPIITAAFVTPSEIKARSKISLDSPRYNLRQMFSDEMDMLKSALPPFVNRIGWYAYGPDEELAPYLKRQGHVMNANGGYVSALLQVSPNAAIPHLALTGDRQLSLVEGGIRWEDQRIPTTARGEILVDFLSPNIYYKNSRRILQAIQDAQSPKGDVRSVDKGDVVLILSAMYTGSVDFTESPVGHMPGGFVVASILNSRLSGTWFDYQGVLQGVGIVALAGALIAAFVPTTLVLPVLFLTLALTLAAAFGLFIANAVVTSLTASIFMVWVYSLAIILQKFDLLHRMNRMIRYLRDENMLMQSELRQANEISQVFVPTKTTNWTGFEIGTFHRPMTMGSGDWYVFEKSQSGTHLHYVMCDISGHGVQAAIIVSTCRTVMSMMASEQPHLLESADFIDHYVATLNRTLVRQGNGRHTATLVAVSFTEDSPEVRIVVCGHPRPVLFQSRDNMRPVLVGRPTSIVGIHEDLVLYPSTFELLPQDSLMIYTDGVELPRVLDKALPYFRRYLHVDADTAAKFFVTDMWERRKSFGNHVPDDVSLALFRRLAVLEKTDSLPRVDASKAV